MTVIRAARHGGDTKTPRSRRKLQIPVGVADVLERHADRLGVRWEHSKELVFPSTTGTLLDPSHVRPEFKAICQQAGIEGD